MYARAIMLVAGGESRMFVGHDHSDGDRNGIRAAEFCACWVSSDPSVFEDGPRRCCQLHERKHQVEALAAALLQEGSLDAGEIAAILSGRPDVTRRSRWNASRQCGIVQSNFWDVDEKPDSNVTWLESVAGSGIACNRARRQVMPVRLGGGRITNGEDLN